MHKILLLVSLVFFNFSFALENNNPSPSPEAPTSSRAPEKNYYENWVANLGKFSDMISGVTNSQSLDIFLFNSYFDINQTVYTVDIPTPFPAGVGISVGGNRRVVLNQGIDDFYTVMDKFRISLRPFLSYAAYGISVGVSTPIEIYVTNFRQIGRKEMENLDPLEKTYEKLEKKFNKKNKEYVLALDETDKNFYANFFPSTGDTVERRATWGKFWNPITMNFRLPLTPKAADRMSPREILGYTILGGLEMGAGLGLPFSIPGGMDKSILKPGVDASVYFKGTYELVVLKEKPLNPGDNFVRLKINRARGLGYSLGFGSGTDSIRSLTSGHLGPLEGNFVWTLVSGLVSVRPFRINWDQSYWQFFNQTYRFNLNNPNAREAYQKAVLGNLKLAEKMAFDEKGNIIKDSPVTRILTSKEKVKIKGHYRGINMFLLTLQKSGVIKTSDKILVDEKLNTHEYFESEALNSRVVEALFKYQERRTHQFKTMVNLKSYEKDPKDKDTISLLIDVNLSDSNTKSKEYLSYIKEVENSLNLHGFFPLPPLSDDKEWFRGNFGATSFSYNLKINLTQIEKFINYPQEKMWEALTEAFDAKDLGWDNPDTRKKQLAKSIAIYATTMPVSIIGQKFPPKDAILIASIKQSRWEKLKEDYLKGPKEFVKALGNFFNIGDYGPEMIKLLRVVLSGEKIPFKLNSLNPLLSNANVNLDQIGEITHPLHELEFYSFDRYDQNFDKVNIPRWSAEVLSDQYIRFIVEFDKEPKSIFFNMERSRFNLSLTKTFWGSVTILNKNRIFKKGLNTIMIKFGDTKHPWNHLINTIELKKSILFPEEYKFSIAASLDEKHFGNASRTIIRAILLESPQEINKYIKYTAEDFNLCLGKSAIELILFLDNRPLLVCPVNAPRNPDGTCREGMYPYDWMKNAPLEENLKKRNSWIYKNCPSEGSEDYISKITQYENICMGKKADDIIKSLGDRPFYVCPLTYPKNPDGTCVSGLIPYYFNVEGDNLKSRNEWIIKNCNH